MKTTILTFILTMAGITTFGQGFYLTFNEPTNNAVVPYAHYDLWYQAVNTTNPTSWNWVSATPVGTTNITIPAGLPNPVVLTMTATDSNNTQSDYAPSLMLNTNAWRVLPPWGGRIIRR